MKTVPRAGVAARSLLLAALVAAVSASPFSGCGGTTVETGNPGLVVGFRKNGAPADFEGMMRVYAHGSDPAFFTPRDTGAGPGKAGVDFSGKARTNVFISLGARPVHVLSWAILEQAAGFRLALPFLPAHVESGSADASALEGEAGLRPDRPFNLIFDDRSDRTTAFVTGITVDAEGKRFLDAEGAPLETLWVDLIPPGAYTGTVDTTGLGDTALVLYAPGSPWFARVHGNRFHLRGMPLAPLPVRLVTARGNVHPFPSALPVTRALDQPALDTLPALLPGARIDSLEMPAPLAVLAAPVASPAGPHDFTDSLTVSLAAEPGAAIHYTLDGSTPGLHSPPYDGPLTLRASATLKAVAYRRGAHHSPVSINNYTLVPPPPRALPGSRAFRDSLAVALAADAKGAVVHYTLDGSEPGRASPVYAGPLVLRATTFLKAVTAVPGLGLSRIAEERYIRVTDTLAAP